MSFDGVWRSRGYGWCLQLGTDGYALHDVTASACVEFERGSRQEFDAGFEIVSPDGDAELRLQIRNDITTYDFDRIPSLPAGTLRLDDPKDASPESNFRFFREVFEQDYAFFKLRGVDWPRICDTAAMQVRPDMSADELFSVLHSLTTPLQDNHVILTDGSRTVTSEKIADIKSLLNSSLGLSSATIGNPKSIEILNPYLNDAFLGGKATTAANNSFLWGMVTPTTGYLNVLRFFGLADNPASRAAVDLPPRRPEHAAFLAEDINTVKAVMRRVIDDLQDAETIILDVRLNGGGFDNVGMLIADHFTDRKRLAFTKQARIGDSLSPSQDFYIAPAAGPTFDKPVYVLTSQRTASAGDVFALCMRALPQATIVGQPSAGILSDNLAKHLPNGWRTSISNEIYCSPSGQVFEGPGVPVDIPAPVFVADDFEAGYRVAFNLALSLCAGRVTSAVPR